MLMILNTKGLAELALKRAEKSDIKLQTPVTIHMSAEKWLRFKNRKSLFGWFRKSEE